MIFKRFHFIIFILGIFFLLARNLPLCFIMPIWAHGDEIGHFDYIMKLNRWHLPHPREQIEISLFLFHKANWDSRIISTERYQAIKDISDMGIAGYSYEAHHPPLPYVILCLSRISLFLKTLPLLLQVKILRVMCLFVVVLSLSIIYIFLRRNKVNNILFYLPLGLIPLLAQDMYFSINTDVFSFLFASVAMAGLLTINNIPLSYKGWLLLTTGIILSLWTKASNIFLVFWPILVLLIIKDRSKKALAYSFISLLSIVILASPWYIFNYLRFSNFLIDKSLPYPLLPPRGLSCQAIKEFLLAFMRTLFRGEFFWNGRYFDLIPDKFNPLVMAILPLIVFLAGVFFLTHMSKYCEGLHIIKLSYLIPLLTFSLLIVIYLFLGGIPYYHARLSFSWFYFLFCLYSFGWKAILSSEKIAVLISLAIHLIFNLFYTIKLIIKITS